MSVPFSEFKIHGAKGQKNQQEKKEKKQEDGISRRKGWREREGERNRRGRHLNAASRTRCAGDQFGLHKGQPGIQESQVGGEEGRRRSSARGCLRKTLICVNLLFSLTRSVASSREPASIGDDGVGFGSWSNTALRVCDGRKKSLRLQRDNG